MFPNKVVSNISGAAFVAQLAEQSLLTPQVQVQTSVKLYTYTVIFIEKTKIKKKEAGNRPIIRIPRY